MQTGQNCYLPSALLKKMWACLIFLCHYQGAGETVLAADMFGNGS